jgi:DNA-directed RNA polymerase subunit RPC12/RpoP
MLRLPINRAATWAMLVVLVVGGALVTAPGWGQAVLPVDTALVTAPTVGVGLAGLAFAGLCVLVRCRACGYRLFWHAVSRRDHRDGILWFLTAERCPECGHTRA